jgi:hypothetical protein
MYCSGGHLGFPIGIKNIKFVEDLLNVHWMVLYKLYVFCSDMKFKMADTAGLSLTLDPMGKMFENISSLRHLNIFPKGPILIYVLRWRPSWISDRLKKHSFVEDLPMIIPGQFGFNCPSGFGPFGKIFKCLLLRNYKYD